MICRFKILFLLFLSLQNCIKKKNSDENKKNILLSDAEKKTKKEELWTCPMHPQIRKNAPGRCPICGMDLVLVETEGSSSVQKNNGTPKGHTAFQLSSERVQMIGVKYGVIEKKLLFKSIEAPGRVAFDPELFTAQNEYLETLKQLDRVKDSPLSDVKHSAQKMLDSTKLRLKILGLSDQQIDKLRSQEGNLTSNLLLSNEGKNIWIYVEVFEMDLSLIHPNLSVKIRGSSIQGEELAGKVISVDRIINPQTRTGKVRVQVAKSNTELRPQTYVDATILSPLGEQMVVPFDAILDSGKETWIFLVKENNLFQPIKIRIKHYAGDEVAIAEIEKNSLHAGDKIVTSANFLIDSESRLQGVFSLNAGTNY